MHSLMKWIDYNRYVVLGILVAGFLCLWLFGCPATTSSVVNPGLKVTAQELELEAADIAASVKKLKIAKADIQRQVEMRKKVVEIAGGLATLAVDGAVNPATGIAAFVQIATLAVGAGAVADNRRKDKVIKGKKTAT